MPVKLEPGSTALCPLCRVLFLPNPPPKFEEASQSKRIDGFPDHQEGSDARRRGATTEAVYCNTLEGGAREGNAADETLMVDQGLS